MTEHAEDLTTKEVLKRIDILEKKLARLTDYLYQLSEISMDRHKAQATDFESAFERIKNIEAAVFPNLLNDIRSVHQIIGGNGVPAEEHPLDNRNASPRNAGSGKPESV